MQKTRKLPYRTPSRLDEPLGAVEVHIEIEQRNSNGDITHKEGVGSAIFGNSAWELEVLWNAVQVLEQDFGISRDELQTAVRQVLQQLESDTIQ
jgi:hypothetical protein